MKKVNRNTLVTAKGIYLCMLTVYALLREVLSIQEIVGSSLITYVFFCVGVLLAAVMVLSDTKAFLRKSQWLPMIFLVTCCVSTIVNRRFDFMSNVKAIAWMTLYFMLLLPEHGNAAEERNHRWIITTAVVAVSVLALISVPMYYFDVDYTYVKSSGFYNNQGFSQEYMRLWGVYIDSNTAGVYSLVGICFAVYLFAKTKKLFVRILLGAVCIVLFQMVALTNSRTALVALLAAAAWIGVCIAFSRGSGSPGKRIFTTLLAAVITAAVAYGAYGAVQFGMPYVKVALQRSMKPASSAAVHHAYDRLFKSSTLNITDGFFVEVPVETETTEPTAAEMPVETEAAEHTATEADPIETTTPVVESLNRTDKKSDFSNGRFTKWTEVLEVFQHMPILGASPRGISSAAKQINPSGSVAKFNFAAHNALLEVLAGTGILGFAVAIAILVWLAWAILRSVFSGKTSQEILLYGTVLLIMVCEMMFISDVFFVLTFGGIVFWLAAGRIFAIDPGAARTAKKE